MTKRDMLQATATEKSSNEENAELTNVLQYLGEAVGALVDSRESRESRRDTRILSSARSCGYGVCAGGVYDDWHKDEIQECRGWSALQDLLSVSQKRYARVDVCRAYEVYDSQIWEKAKGKRVKGHNRVGG